MSDAQHEKITMRHLGRRSGPQAADNSTPISSDEVRAMRERANMSQAVFAHHLNISAGFLSQIERGVKYPQGPALALLNVIRRKGIETIL